VNDRKFNQESVEDLIKMWEPGATAFLKDLRRRSEIVHGILKETTKPGCKREFSAAVRRLGIGESTAWDMRLRHRVNIGEIPDPDAPDPRDEEEGQAQGQEVPKGDTCEPFLQEYVWSLRLPFQLSR